MRVRSALCALVAVVLAAVGCGGSDDRPIPDGPNVVIVTTDDQSLHTFTRRVMPRTFDLVVDRGTNFSSALAAPPLCCPSRAGLITGQYPHNDGVFGNHPGYSDLIDPDQTLPVWLHDAGYETGLVGKYLNGTVDVLHGEAAPGWDYWYEIEDLSYFGATGYENGEEFELGDDYSPTAVNDHAVDFIHDSAGERPFFLWVSQTAPHARNDEGGACPGKSPQPLPGDLAEFSDSNFLRSPSFNEADVSDKPKDIRELKPLTVAEQRTQDELLRCTAAALQEVDRGVAQIWDTLEEEGEADDTVLLFNSDNGLFFGEHRIQSGKGQPYEEALRVPMAIRVPEGALDEETARDVSQLVTNQDIAPTLEELAGIEPCTAGGECREQDGRSLVPLMQGELPGWSRDRAVLVEQGSSACKYAGIRTPDWLYNETLKLAGDNRCKTVGTELYDLRRDPDELENLSGEEPAEAELRARLEALRKCAGTTGPEACE